LSVDASALGASDTLTFTGSGETDGSLTVTGGAGGDFIEAGLHHTVVNAGDGKDSVFLFGGLNIVNGGAGDDVIRVDAPISAGSQFDGGSGGNQIIFNGDFSGGQVIGAHWGTNIGDVAFNPGHSYNMTLRDGFVAAGQTQYFYGNTLFAGDTLSIDASRLTAGNVYLQGGHGSDTLIGGAGDDIFEARQGKDSMTGGAGTDSFFFDGVADSTGATFDRITDFNAANEHLHLGFGVTAIDAAVAGGGLSTSNIDSKLPVEIGAAQLHAGDAVLFTPSSGTLANHLMLVVDANGIAGYQAGADYVIDLTGMTGTLSTGNF
jgi:Ca2+-binding RTX toxin-like protein